MIYVDDIITARAFALPPLFSIWLINTGNNCYTTSVVGDGDVDMMDPPSHEVLSNAGKVDPD